MKQIAQLCLCITLLAGPAAAVVAETGRQVGTSPPLWIAPDNMRPWCAEPGASGAPWATRHPKQYQDWESSVHGQAYFAGNPDAPDCLDCHGEPEDGIIRTPQFRLDIPARCASCHDDEQLIARNELAGDVYASYRVDYHGATIEYYRRHDSSRWRYEAVCSDCHRSHAIYGPDDPRSSFSEENLLATCRLCHPKAEGSFTAITTGHFRTDRENAPLAYYIQAIYQVLIPLVIGLMLAYVGLDLFSRLRKKLMGAKR